MIMIGVVKVMVGVNRKSRMMKVCWKEGEEYWLILDIRDYEDEKGIEEIL